METDRFFWQLFSQLPGTLFELLGQPGELARAYRFEAVEVKKSLRIDGLMSPLEAGLPAYFVEVQFHRSAKFYANLFAKVFCYLEANDPGQDWKAVALFESRQLEPKHLGPYEELLASNRVARIYLDELQMPADPPIGLGILQLLKTPKAEVSEHINRLKTKAKTEIRDSEMHDKVIELVEELLLRRFTELDREEIRKMFGLQDIRKSRVWQEAQEEAVDRERRAMVQNCLEQGMSFKAIAKLMKITEKEVRRLSK